MIRVFIVDDHAIVREGLSRLLARDETIEIAGEAGSVTEALSLVDDARPHIVVLDYCLGDGDGATICKAIAERAPSAAVIIHSGFLDEEKVRTCLNAGARGFVVKEASSEELVKAIKAVARGETFFDAEMSRKSTRPLFTAVGPLRRGSQVLSPGVRRVLKLAVDGHTNSEIASMTGLSVHTVKTDLSIAYRKLGVNDRSAAAAAAVRLGLA